MEFSLLARCDEDKPDSNTPDDDPDPTETEQRIKQAMAIELLKPRKDLLDRTYLCYIVSSEDAHRTFCGRFGTHLTFHWSGSGDGMAAEENYFDVALVTMESESLELEGTRPGRQSRSGDGFGWVRKLLAEGERSLFGSRKVGCGGELEVSEGDSK